MQKKLIKLRSKTEVSQFLIILLARWENLGRTWKSSPSKASDAKESPKREHVSRQVLLRSRLAASSLSNPSPLSHSLLLTLFRSHQPSLFFCPDPILHSRPYVPTATAQLNWLPDQSQRRRLVVEGWVGSVENCRVFGGWGPEVRAYRAVHSGQDFKTVSEFGSFLAQPDGPERFQVHAPQERA